MLALGIVDLDLVGGQVEVTPVVHGQSVRARVSEEGLVGKSALLTLVDVVPEGFASPMVGDVEVLAVRGAEDAVGALHVVDDAEDLVAVGCNVVDVLSVLREILVAVVRVAEKDAAVGMDPEVVRLVEALSVELVGHELLLTAVVVEGLDGAFAPEAGHEVPLGGKVKPVGSPRVLEEDGKLLCLGVPAVNPVVGDVGEEEHAVRAGGGALRENEAVSQFYGLGPFGNEGIEPACGFLPVGGEGGGKQGQEEWQGLVHDASNKDRGSALQG